MRNPKPVEPSAAGPAAPDVAEPLAQLCGLWLQGGLAACRAAGEALDLWRHAAEAWGEAVVEVAAKGPLYPEAAGRLMSGWVDVAGRAASLQLQDAGLAAPLLNDP